MLARITSTPNVIDYVVTFPKSYVDKYNIRHQANHYLTNSPSCSGTQGLRIKYTHAAMNKCVVLYSKTRFIVGVAETFLSRRYTIYVPCILKR